jgi:hypothetical protein
MSCAVNIDNHPKNFPKRQGVQQTLLHNHSLLEALLEEGTHQLKQHIHTEFWPVAYAQACGLYCCASRSMAHVQPGTREFDQLVQRCLATAAYLVQTPLLVQPGDRQVSKRREVSGDDAPPGKQFCDMSKGAITLHAIMIAREVVVSLAEDFPKHNKLAVVTEGVYESVVSSDPCICKHSMAIDDAIEQLRVKQLRDRMRACRANLRCWINLHTFNCNNICYVATAGYTCPSGIGMLYFYCLSSVSDAHVALHAGSVY